LNLVGKPCTLHPFSDDGVRLPRTIDMRVIARAFHTAVEEELERAGLGVKLAGPGDPDEGIVITGRFVRVSAGNRLLRYFAPFLRGAAAIVEVEGLVADGEIPIANVSGMGKRGLGPLGGASPAMLSSAAQIAGVQLGRQALETLAG
jgi:hypothetical protein